MTVASNAEPDPRPAAAPRDAQLGHARRLPRLPAQLPRAAGRRPLPRRRRLGSGDAHAPTTTRRKASRMTPADVAQAVAWSKAHGLRIDFAFNGGGSDALQGRPTGRDRPAARRRSPMPATRSAFGWINHTYEHPNLDCSTAPFITKADRRQRRLGARARPPARPATRGRHRRALGPGEHAPGQPGHDRPAVVRRRRRPARPAGRWPAGTYDYALTAHVAGRRDDRLGRAGRSPSPATRRCTASFNAVCHARRLQALPPRRRAPARGRWSATLARAAERARPTTATTPIDADDHRHRRGGHGRRAAGGQRRGARALRARTRTSSPGIAGRGRRRTSRPTRRRPTRRPDRLTSALLPAGAPFTEGTGRRLPGRPALPEQRLLQRLASRASSSTSTTGSTSRRPTAAAACRSPASRTCRTTPATWARLRRRARTTIMFRHLMGNDPRPHYMHQSNLADYNPALPETDPNQGGILYAVIDGLLGALRRGLRPRERRRWSSSPDADRRRRWRAGRVGGERGRRQGHARGCRTASCTSEPRRADMDVPLTGTTVGDVYGGQQSGLTTVKAGTEAVFSPDRHRSSARAAGPQRRRRSRRPRAAGRPAAGGAATPAAGRRRPQAPAVVPPAVTGSKPAVKPAVKPVAVKLDAASR